MSGYAGFRSVAATAALPTPQGNVFALPPAGRSYLQDLVDGGLSGPEYSPWPSAPCAAMEGQQIGQFDVLPFGDFLDDSVVAAHVAAFGENPTGGFVGPKVLNAKNEIKKEQQSLLDSILVESSKSELPVLSGSLPLFDDGNPYVLVVDGQAPNGKPNQAPKSPSPPARFCDPPSPAFRLSPYNRTPSPVPVRVSLQAENLRLGHTCAVEIKKEPVFDNSPSPSPPLIHVQQSMSTCGAPAAPRPPAVNANSPAFLPSSPSESSRSATPCLSPVPVASTSIPARDVSSPCSVSSHGSQHSPAAVSSPSSAASRDTPSPLERPKKSSRSERKRQQNKDAAIRYRKKKQAEQQRLNRICQQLRAENSELLRKRVKISNEIAYVKSLLVDVMNARRERAASKMLAK